MKISKMMIAIIVLGCAVFVKDCLSKDWDTGVSGDILVGVSVYSTEEKAKPGYDCDAKPTVFTKLQYTFDGGNQIYIGTLFENEGEPTVGATFGHGLFDVSVFYIAPVDVYKDPYLADRAETTEDGFGGKFALNIQSFKAGYELRHTQVKKE